MRSLDESKIAWNKIFMADLKSIQKLEESLLDPKNRKNAALLSSLLHDDFEEIGTSGTSINKTQALEWLLKNENHIQWKLSDFRIKTLTADLVIALYQAQKTNSQTQESKNYSRTSIWKKQNQKWSLIFHQDTTKKNPGS